MKAKLVIVGGKASKSHVSVELPTIIGRSREADLTVAHPMISRKHCELYEVNGLVMVRDLGSLNGLFVGGRQVNEAALHPSAEFTVGPLTFRVEYAYVDQIVSPPDASTVDETAEPPEAALGGEQGDFEVLGHHPEEPETAFAGEEGDFEVVDHHPEVAPPQAVDFGNHPLSGEEQPASGDAEPGSTGAQPVIAPPDGQLPDFSAWGGAAVAETAQGQVVTPSPPVVIPKTTAFEQAVLADLEAASQPPVDAAQRHQGPELPGVPPGEAEPPADESLDLSRPLESESPRSDDTGRADDEFDKFLKGLE